MPGAEARGRRALNGGGGVQVIPGDLVQTLLLYARHERRVGDHIPFVVLDEEVVQILRVAPELRPGLDEDLVELVETNESLLPGAADEDVEVVHRCLDRHALLHGDVIVDDQLVLRVVRGVEGEQVRHLLAFFQGGHELVGHFSEPLVIGGERLVEDEHGDTPGGAESGDRGRLEELELHVADLVAFLFELHDDLACGSLAFGPVSSG